MKSRSFIIKILFYYLVIIFLFILFVFIIFFNQLKADGIKSAVNSLNLYAQLIDDELNQLLQNRTYEKVNVDLGKKANELGIRITYINMDGQVIFDSENDPSAMDNHGNRPEIIKALNGENNYITRYSRTLHKDMVYYAYTIRAEGEILGVLRLSMYLDDLDRIMRALQIKYLVIIFFLVTVSILSMLVIYYNFKKHIKQFTQISQQVSEIDFTVTYPPDESYEILELSKSFKNMVNKIKELIFELRYEKEESDSIISSIKEGIALIDKKGIILRSNESFQQLFKTGMIKGKYYWEVIRSNEICMLIKNIGREDTSIQQIELDDQEFLFSIHPLQLKEAFVLILYNITELKTIERIKKDLAANASHELRTPLTAIRGFVETLLDEEKAPEKIKYLEIILRHTARLTNIINDLLTLSKLEDKKLNIPFETVDLRKIINDILPVFQQALAEKKLTFEFIAGDHSFFVQGDPFKLEQLFINLLDNAIKYTDQGGITIRLTQGNQEIKAEIIDTGIGIPDNEKSRIFERFYVVDKSRSRQLGGTGLGLSIVKHIIIQHRGEIRVENNSSQGTKFIIILPLSLTQS